MSPPPLPDPLVLEILSYLLPPAPPLPQHLLAEPLVQRITFLTPAVDDTDAWISPSPSSSSQPLSSRLSELAKEHRLGDAEYAHDGESVLGRRKLIAEHGGVELQFAWEHSADHGEWKFHGVFLPGATKAHWGPQIPHVPDIKATDGEQHPSDYWAGFSPHSETIDLAEPPTEEDYWAQYSGTVSHRSASPALPKDRPAPVARALSSRTSPVTTPSSLPKLSPRAMQHRLRNGDTLRPRLLQKIKSLLRHAWLDFADGDAALEERANLWLCMVRDLHRVSIAEGDAEERIVRGKLQVLEEMYGLVEEHEDGFYRLAEEALRAHDQVDLGRTYSNDQVGYWE